MVSVIDYFVVVAGAVPVVDVTGVPVVVVVP
jgi:hypothetical protein